MSALLAYCFVVVVVGDGGGGALSALEEQLGSPLVGLDLHMDMDH